MLNRITSRIQALRLSPTCRQVRRERLTYLNEQKCLRLERAIKRVDRLGVRGDFCEFGVALGGSGIVLAKFAQAQGRAFHGFDVFEMIPPPTSEKDGEDARQRYKVIREGKSAGIGGDTYYGYVDDLISNVRVSFDRHGVPVDGEAICLHKGLFQDTWPIETVDSVALAHIDCDWYDPVRYCLDQTADKMAPGAMFLIDDYNDYGGARVAVDEFVSERSDFVLEPGRNPYVVKI
ncbi:TylF/MycF/NovP-related O-methyltransferase [Altererythrobacter sp. GH1-8]|uniref:TylF/MycF/NovP-related O-methyltransferase n=1 Tax=Altererythrobacter sp. GH1-8 TaxID=3349333 RepID=UPI00374D0DF5